jgi:hypothetical protein
MTTASPAALNLITLSLTMAEFRHLALGKTLSLIKDVADREDQRASDFVKRTPTPLERYWTTSELKAEARTALTALAVKYPQLGSFVTAAEPILDRISTANSAFILLDAYERLLALEDIALPDRAHIAASLFRITADSRQIYLTVSGDYLGQRSALAQAIERDTAHVRFMASVCALTEELRERRRRR